MSAIEMTGLTKRYGAVTAVDGLDLTVDEGTVFGFLGPNGAGKSTVINCLLDYIRPTAGSIAVLGYDPQEDARSVRERVGVLPQGFGVYDRLTGRQHLSFIIDSVGTNDDPDAIAARVGIAEAIDQRAGGYSRGMAQRLMLGTALVGDPDLLVLDEPSSGLDPDGVRTMREIVREEADRGTTVFFSSHILDQVEAVCDRVGIMQDGDLIADNSIAGLRTAAPSQTKLVIDVEQLSESAVDAVRSIEAVESATVVDAEVTVYCADSAKAAVIRELDDAGATVVDFTVRTTSLEELYLSYTESTAAAGSAGAETAVIDQ